MRTATIEKVIKKLKSQKDLGYSTIVFLGAGASVSSGIPLASGMVEYIKQNFDLSDVEDDYFQIMEELYPADRKRVFESFSKHASINETHLITALLIYFGYVDIVITTNFDPLLKRAISLLSIDIQVIDVPNNVKLHGHKISTPSIYYLHGEHTNIWQSNTIPELKKIEPDLYSLFSNISINRSLIIVGYSGNDPIFNIMADFEKFENGLFWIGFENNPPDNHIKENLLDVHSKSAFYVQGFNSDKFFERVINSLGVLNTEVIGFLNKTLVLSKTQQKLHQNKSLHFNTNINPIKLTNSCRSWIEQHNKLQKTTVHIEGGKGIFDKVNSWFNWLFKTTDPFVDEVQIYMFNGDFEGALEVIETALAEDENNYIAHYYKGNALVAQAEDLEDPRERKSLYERAKISFDSAKSLMMDLEETPDVLQELDETVVYYWAEEFNSGVNILNDDSAFAATPDPNFIAIAHFDNSIAVLPDRALPYQVKASAYFNEDDVDNAVSSYENAMDRLPNPEIADYEFMISILLVQPDYDRAIYYSEKARADFPDETVFVQLQADAYLQAGEQDQALALVEGLIADDPDNPQYRRVLGTQIYQRVGEISDSVSPLYEEAFKLRREIRILSGSQQAEAQARLDRMQAEIDQKELEMDELTELSVNQMKRVVELEPDSESAHFILGIIYQNQAASLFERRNNTEDNAEAQNLDERARENLKEALVYYEKAAEIDPDNPENWQSLFQVYTTLGMEEKAMEAMKYI